VAVLRKSRAATLQANIAPATFLTTSEVWQVPRAVTDCTASTAKLLASAANTTGAARRTASIAKKAAGTNRNA
jgi:hypothetical protein